MKEKNFEFLERVFVLVGLEDSTPPYENGISGTYATDGTYRRVIR